MPVRLLLVMCAAFCGFALLQPAFADRAPMPEERGRIEQKLGSSGFQTWGEVALDDGKWEIEDARRADGKKYELKLNFDNLELIKQEEDD